MFVRKSRYKELQRLCQNFSDQFKTISEILQIIVADQRTITVDTTNPAPAGLVKWHAAGSPAGTSEMTIWFVPTDERAEANVSQP